MPGASDSLSALQIVWSVAVMLAGMGLLVMAGDWLVAGAVKLAARVKVPAFFIGLTVVAFGTSAPELFVAIGAALGEDDGLIFGNVVGSNICNLLLVLGLPALLYGLSAKGPALTLATFLMMGSTALFAALLLFRASDFEMMMQGETLPPLQTNIRWWEGLILVLLIPVILFLTSSRGEQEEEVEDIASDPLPFGFADTIRNIVLILGAGIAGLTIGADWTVTNAVLLGQTIPGVSPEAVGLTVIALGTSLPELSATIAAARRQQFDIGFGNILGSNMFNIHAVAGIAALVSAGGLNVPPDTATGHPIGYDIFILFAVTGLVSFYLIGRNPVIDRMSGLLFVALYACYMFFLIAPLL